MSLYIVKHGEPCLFPENDLLRPGPAVIAHTYRPGACNNPSLITILAGGRNHFRPVAEQTFLHLFFILYVFILLQEWFRYNFADLPLTLRGSLGHIM